MIILRHFRNVFILLTGLVIAGCSLSDMAAKLLPDEAEIQMVNIIDAITRQDLEFIKDQGSEEFNAVDNIEEGFEAIFKYIVPGDVLETKLVNAHINYNNPAGRPSVTFYTGQYERTYDAGVNLYTIVMVKKEGQQCCKLQNVNIRKFDVSPSEATKFTLKNKSIKHYSVLALAFIVPLFIVFTLVKCIRTKGLKRKWLWIIFILFGMYGITFNWYNGDLTMSFLEKRADGGVTFNFISLNLLGVGVAKTGPLSPWIFDIGFPLGAVLFWFKLRKMARATAAVFADEQ